MMTMRLASIAPDARVRVYQILRALFLLLPALGIAVPGDPSLWDQLVLAVLGLAGAAGATLAIVHVPPAQGKPEPGE
ncbi:major facilitator transporter [Segniliparus rotundus DSM 44985]|uniref:Major facilitator transporter n=1 Tax=Segniliparus rotundus (strain ATCC BAA-972 / CDC 1076 / CIP 108378 / DSM 44985 / JCM 13578) TaxID=640132 RepID=D6ZAU4_SEGRD|nr:hypothetical protein [Segniliparus rotundus]ADG98830.1 major facilitator transporter [Segniliparus rotundus DSM 44985]